MAGYTRQSTFADGDTITAALFNNEYNQLLNAFGNTGGHKHDGTANEGPVIGLIGDAGVVTPLNKVLIDSTKRPYRVLDRRIKFFCTTVIHSRWSYSTCYR